MQLRMPIHQLSSLFIRSRDPRIEVQEERVDEDVPQVKAYEHIPSLSQISPISLPLSHSPPHPQTDLTGIKPTIMVYLLISSLMMVMREEGSAKIRKWEGDVM